MQARHREGLIQVKTAGRFAWLHGFVASVLFVNIFCAGVLHAKSTGKSQVVSKQAQSLKSQMQSIEGRLAQSFNEMSGLERQLAALLETSQVNCIQGQEHTKGSTNNCGRVEERLSEGQILLSMKNYQRASVVLFDAVETPGFDKSMLYDEAVYSLAEALYLSDNVIGARGYYRLLVQRGARMYVQNAIKRLIEIAGRVRDYRNLDEYYAAYLQLAGRGARPEVAYVWAKYLIKTGRYQEARQSLQSIHQQDPLWLRAKYLDAVARLSMGDEQASQKALELFAVVAQAKPRDANEKDVRELAFMAMGRLNYELGHLNASVDSYQNISRHSPHFADMLFEVAWTFIKRGQQTKDPNQAKEEIKKALQAIDLIMVPDTELEAEIAILRGNLYMRLNETQKAERVFSGITKTYRPTVDKLQALMKERGDAGKLLQDILAADEKHLSVDSLLPPLAAKWAHGKDEIDESLRVYKELRASTGEVKSARAVASKIQHIIAAPNLAELLPSISEVQARGLNVRDQLINMRSQLTSIQGKLMNAESIKGFREAVADRKALEKKFNAIPKTREGMSERFNRIADRIEGLEAEVFKISIAVDEQRAQVVSISKWLVDQKQRGQLAAQDEKIWRDNLGRAEQTVDYLAQQQQELEAEIHSQRERLSFSGGADSQESLIRTELQAALRKEALILAKAKANADEESRKNLAKVDAMGHDLEILIRRADTFQRRLDSEIKSYAQAMQRAVDVENGRIDSYEREILHYQNEAGDVAANAAVLALRGVRDDFKGFVLRADVGLIDLAWRHKREKSDEISALVKKQRNELRTLDMEFGEVLNAEE